MSSSVHALAVRVLTLGALVAAHVLLAGGVRGQIVLDQPVSVADDGGALSSRAAVDVDGDGLLDLVLGRADGPRWFRNDGGGAFSEQPLSGPAGAPRLLDARDLDGDGLGDLLLEDAGTVRPHLGDGAGHFAPG